MARTKTRGGAAPGAPKPRIEPRRTPFLRRRATRWALLAILIAVAVVVTLLILGRIGRANALRAYDDDVRRALLPFTQHQAETVPDSFVALPTQFDQGTVSPDRLGDAAARWAVDFAQAASNVRLLEPPAELEDANELIAQAMDAYAGVARLYGIVAETRRFAEEEDGRAARRFSSQVQQWLAQIGAAGTRADALLSAGRSSIQELRVAWGVDTPAPTPELSEIPPGLLPDGGSHPS